MSCQLNAVSCEIVVMIAVQKIFFFNFSNFIVQCSDHSVIPENMQLYYCLTSHQNNFEKLLDNNRKSFLSEDFSKNKLTAQLKSSRNMSDDHYIGN